MWDPRARRLWWLDIDERRLWAATRDGTADSWALPGRAGAIVLRSAGGIVVVGDDGPAVFDEKDATFTRLVAVDPPMRFNDGKCDARGRLWVGSMGPKTRTGGLHRFHPDGSIADVLEGLGIPNGICWSPDGRRLYVAESMDARIDAYPFDPDTGSIGPAEELVDCGSATPDGAAVDCDGGMWSVRWEGGCIVRHRPDGTVARVVELPVTCPTSCAFGGDGLRELFVTSARRGRRWSAGRMEGAVLVVDAGVAGLPVGSYAG